MTLRSFLARYLSALSIFAWSFVDTWIFGLAVMIPLLLGDPPMEIVKENDPRLKFVFQGVRQDENRLNYRIGELDDGKQVKVQADVNRPFHLEGTFGESTMRVIHEGEVAPMGRTIPIPA
jgi:hypothetical protein